MTLDSVPTGTPVVLGRPEVPADRALRLAQLGLRPGATVVPLHRTAGGGRVVAVGDARVAVARVTLGSIPASPPTDER